MHGSDLLYLNVKEDRHFALYVSESCIHIAILDCFAPNSKFEA